MDVWLYVMVFPDRFRIHVSGDPGLYYMEDLEIECWGDFFENVNMDFVDHFRIWPAEDCLMTKERLKEN